MVSHCFLPFLVLLSFFSSSFPIAVADKKVKLSVYYDSLCPASQEFIVTNLSVFLDNTNADLLNIVDLKLVPYGNARIHRKRILCQHGEDECRWNRIQACSVQVLPDVYEHLSFISCLELAFLTNEGDVYDCLDSWSVYEQDILQCSSNRLGKKLQLHFVNETHHLYPPHKFVPWVVVDNKPLRQDFKNILAYVCKAYKGTKVPKVCKKPHLQVVKVPKVGDKHVCHKITHRSSSKPTKPVTPGKV